MDLIQFGKRYTVFSPKDNQPCMDHDRQLGEGVVPREYTLVKLGLRCSRLSERFQGSKISLLAATLRPETMYGQTNCFVHPEMEYGLYRLNDKELAICSPRSARNLQYQGHPTFAKPVHSFMGRELIGTQVDAPLSVYKRIYILPMSTISMSKVCAMPWASE